MCACVVRTQYMYSMYVRKEREIFGNEMFPWKGEGEFVRCYHVIVGLYLSFTPSPRLQIEKKIERARELKIEALETPPVLFLEP